MQIGNESDMSCGEKIKKYPLYYLFKFFCYLIIITIIFFIEKLIFIIINLCFRIWLLSVLVQMLLHLLLLRYIVVNVEFPGSSFIAQRILQYRIGIKEATFLYNELETFKSALDLIFSKEKPVEELKHLLVIQKNVKSSNQTIKGFYQVFTKMKGKFNKLTFDQNKFYTNITNLYTTFEQSEFLKLLNNIIKKLRTEKAFLIKDLSLEEKEKFYNEKKETEKYIESMKLSLDLLIDQIRDYIGDIYHFYSPRYIRNLIKNYLFASLQQFHVELDNYFNYEEKKLKTKDGNILDYIIIKCKNWINIENKNLLIICGPNADPYQVFSRYIVLNNYLSKGIDILCWNYRGYGFSTGKPTFNNIKSDVIEIYEEAKKLEIYKKIGVHGISIGGVPCCYLANQKKDICLLFSDRNFGQIEGIIRSFPFGKYLSILYKFLLIPSSRNVENYIETNAYKIVLNDPNDEVVDEEGSLKTYISEELCNRYLEMDLNNSFNPVSNIINTSNDNSIELETLDETNSSILSSSSKRKIISKDNLLNDKIILPSKKNYKNQSKKYKSALDVLLLDNKKNFIDCLINISEALNDRKLNINKISICNKIFKIFKKSKKNDEEYSHLKEEELENSIGVCNFIRNKMNLCFRKFLSAGDNLNNLLIKSWNYHKILFIENFFNNLFIWGTYDKIDDYGSVYHSTENIDIMLSKVINLLNLFLNSQEIASFKKIKIIQDIEAFYNYIIKIKNNIRFLGIKNNDGFVFLSDGNNYEKELIKLGRGNLVWLDCGHNGIPCSEENLVIKYYLKQSDLFKKDNKEISSDKDDNFGDKNIFSESGFGDELNTSIDNLN